MNNDDDDDDGNNNDKERIVVLDLPACCLLATADRKNYNLEFVLRLSSG